MNQQFDELTLSAYIDGELDPDTMREVDSFLEQDKNAQKYVLNAVRAAARLRRFMNGDLSENIPEHLISAIRPQPEKKQRRKALIYPLFRMAAAILLVLLGFGAGSFLQRDSNGDFSMLTAAMPTRYSQVVDQALEYNLSGTPREWQAPRSAVIVSVTPVKTYRDRSGLYYREYRLEVKAERESRQIKGLAYRTAGGKWKTKAVFYQ
jgi:surface antigen